MSRLDPIVDRSGRHGTTAQRHRPPTSWNASRVSRVVSKSGVLLLSLHVVHRRLGPAHLVVPDLRACRAWALGLRSQAGRLHHQPILPGVCAVGAALVLAPRGGEDRLPVACRLNDVRTLPDRHRPLAVELVARHVSIVFKIGGVRLRQLLWMRCEPPPRGVIGLKIHRRVADSRIADAQHYIRLLAVDVRRTTVLR